MTRKKTAEVIGIFALAYPFAEIFKATDADDMKKKQAALISLWSAALPDVEDWVAEPAAKICMRTSKFMPSIAEFREAAEELRTKSDAEAREAFLAARDAVLCFPGKEERMMGPRAWAVVQAMGGLDTFAPEGGSFAMDVFESVYKQMLRQTASRDKLLAGKDKNVLSIGGGEE